MWKYKGGDEGKQPLDARVYPMISVGIKPPLVHIVESLKRASLLGNQVSSGDPLIRHKG